MKNKKASLSTFLFVILVIMACFTSLYTFAKHKNIMDRENIAINSVVTSSFQDDVAYIQLKMFSEEAIFYAYNQLLDYYGFNLSSLQNVSYRVFDYSKLKNGNTSSEESYKIKFKSLIQSRYDYLVSKYPQYTSSDKEIFLALKNAKFNFDGENIFSTTILQVRRQETAGIKFYYSRFVSYNSSLDLFGLADLRRISDVSNFCSYSYDMVIRKECILSQFSGFAFDKDFSNFKILNTTQGDFYLTKLVSNTSYFIGPPESGISEIIRPSVYLVLPINSGEEAKLNSIFG